MASDARLPARVQPQVWVNDQAVDVGASIPFDAHDAAVGLSFKAFRRMAEQVFGYGHDYDELAIDSGVIAQWLSAGKDNTFVVIVEEEDLDDWLASVGLDREAALAIDDDGMKALQARVSGAAPAP